MKIKDIITFVDWLMIVGTVLAALVAGLATIVIIDVFAIDHKPMGFLVETIYNYLSQPRGW